MFEVPEGMTIAAFGSHPVRQLIRHSAYTGDLPSRYELDALELSPALRKSVAAACREVAAIHSTGVHEDAWARGDELAVSIVEDLPEEQRDPAWFKGPTDAELHAKDPEALAGLVPRSGR